MDQKEIQSIIGKLYINLHKVGEALEDTQRQFGDLQLTYNALKQERDQLDLDLQANKMVLGAIRKEFPKVDEMISKGIKTKTDGQ